MNTTLSKLLALGMFILCCHSSLANTVIQPSVSNPFQVAQSDPNDIVSKHCPEITQTNNPYVIHTQAGVDIFSLKKYQECKKVPYLVISGQDIKNLDALSNIRRITHGESNYGNGIIIGSTINSDNKAEYTNDSLKHLQGLNNLINVKGDVSIYDNQSLKNINALNNVKYVTGSIVVDFNHSLLRVRLFSNKLKDISGGLDVTDNPEVKYFSDSFSRLKTIDDKTSGLYLYLGIMPKFKRLTKVAGGLSLTGLPYKDFSSLHLNSLKYVGRQISISQNSALESLKGLQGIKSLGQTPRKDDTSFIYFYDNPKLIDCSALSQVYDSTKDSKYVFDGDASTPEDCKTTLEGK